METFPEMTTTVTGLDRLSGITDPGGVAGDLAQQEQPVKNGIPQYPVFIPLSAADAIQVLADGPRGVSKVGDVQVVTPHTGPAHRSGPDRG
jgi:hypothetical protein